MMIMVVGLVGVVVAVGVVGVVDQDQLADLSLAFCSSPLSWPFFFCTMQNPEANYVVISLTFEYELLCVSTVLGWTFVHHCSSNAACVLAEKCKTWKMCGHTGWMEKKRVQCSSPRRSSQGVGGEASTTSKQCHWVTVTSCHSPPHTLLPKKSHTTEKNPNTHDIIVRDTIPQDTIPQR